MSYIDIWIHSLGFIKIYLINFTFTCLASFAIHIQISIISILTYRNTLCYKARTVTMYWCNCILRVPWYISNELHWTKARLLVYHEHVPNDKLGLNGCKVDTFWVQHLYPLLFYLKADVQGINYTVSKQKADIV